MALEPCPECGKPVSTFATACAQCGYPIALRRSVEYRLLPYFVGAFLAGVLAVAAVVAVIALR